LRCAPDDPVILAEALASSLRSPERSLDQRIAFTNRFSYSELAARYLT
jgi:hypothetical protein